MCETADLTVAFLSYDGCTYHWFTTGVGVSEPFLP